MKNDIKGGVITTPLFWDCECSSNFIHPSYHQSCPECGAVKEDSPDSRISEVLGFLMDLFKGGCLNGVIVKEPKPAGEKTAGQLHEERYGEPGPNEEDTSRYVVTWQIDVDAHDPREAARKALAMQKDPNSTATVFKVTGQLGDTHEIDLEEEEEEVTLEEVEEYLQDEWDNASGRERDIFEEALRIVRDSKP